MCHDIQYVCNIMMHEKSNYVKRFLVEDELISTNGSSDKELLLCEICEEKVKLV